MSLRRLFASTIVPILTAVSGASLILWSHGCSDEASDTDGGAGVAGLARSAGGGGGASGRRPTQSPGGASASSGTGAGGVSHSGASGASAVVDDGGECGSLPRDPAVPTDWEVYTGYACDCRLYVPGTKGAMPEPMAWEACPPVLGSPADCRMMAHPWNSQPLFTSAQPRFSQDPKTGAPLIQFARIGPVDGHSPTPRYHLVAEPDGPVRSAILQTNQPALGCDLMDAGLDGDHYLLDAWGASWDTRPTEQGYVGGVLGEPFPTTTARFPFPQGSVGFSFGASTSWIVRWTAGKLFATSWDASETINFFSVANDPDNFPIRGLRPRGKAVFYEVGGSNYSGVWAWTKEGGNQPLLRWPHDGTRGAGVFATDGIDMVWTQGEGRTDPSDNGLYKTMSAMTAKYTTDPTTAQGTARRLRSDFAAGFTPYPWGVGCGHAARAVSVDGTSTDLMVVRLSDGHSWYVRGAQGYAPMQFGFAIGLTCDEVFAIADFNSDVYKANTIVRIRLDSLGAGQAPD
jgi:hypothetical protein